MKLIAFGDSFTYGTELTDRLDSWPQVLGNYLKIESKNYAVPGASNSKILRNLLYAGTDSDIVIIGWSIFSRIEMSDSLGSYDCWPGKNYIGEPKDTDRKIIYEYLNKNYNEEWLYNEYLTKVILAQNYLHHNNVKYIMFDAFENNKYRHYGNLELVKQIKSQFFVTWPNDTLMEWVHGIDETRAPKGHFSELGHQIVAKRLYEYIRNFGWIS